MPTFNIDKELIHVSAHGCEFKSNRGDLKNGVDVVIPASVDKEEAMADFAEWAGWHGSKIYQHLGAFNGYDAITYRIVYEKDEV